jgi:hypothetical protein
MGATAIKFFRMVERAATERREAGPWEAAAIMDKMEVVVAVRAPVPQEMAAKAAQEDPPSRARAAPAGMVEMDSS